MTACRWLHRPFLILAASGLIIALSGDLKAQTGGADGVPSQRFPSSAQETPELRLPPSLVGRWVVSETLIIGQAPRDSPQSMWLRANGTYTAFSVVDATFEELTAARTIPMETGRWRAQGHRLYAQPDGGGTWRLLGTYAFDGHGLRIRAPAGERRIWRREP